MARGMRATVLLVGSVEADLDLERTFLRRHDVRVVEAPESLDAIDVAREARPHVAVVEDRGPDRVGLEICSRLKGSDAPSPRPAVIVLSDADRGGDARGAGADELLLRPLEREVFLRAVGRFAKLRDRRFARFPMNLRFSFEYDGQAGQAFSRELSTNGAFLKTDWVPELGHRIPLAFRLPGEWRELRCVGVVRRIVGYDAVRETVPGFAVEFDDLDVADQARLDRYMERRGAGGER